MEDYKGYKLSYYPKYDNRYQISKPRPYDDADYYWAYTYDKENWRVVFKGKLVKQFKGNFKEVVDFIEEKNKDIKPKMMHW